MFNTHKKSASLSVLKHLSITAPLLLLILALLPGCQLQPTKAKQTHKQILASSHPLKLPINQPVPNTQPEDILLEMAIIDKTTRPLTLTEKTWPYPNYIQTLPSTKPTNLWTELTTQFFLSSAHHDKFLRYIPYYKRNVAYINRVTKRAQPYLYFILDEIKKRQMPYEIALLPMVESGFSATAKSYVSATGLWQFMPATGDMYGLKRNWWYDGRKDIYQSTLAALDYLQTLYKLNHHDWLLALASYNAGYGNVLKAQKKYRQKHPNGIANFWNIQHHLPTETQNYVPQLLAGSYVIKHRNEFNIHIQPIENKPYFKKISLKNQVALHDIAKHSDTNMQRINLLNPGYLKPTTPPKGPYDLLIPIEKSKKLITALNNTPTLFRIHWARHKIKSGESLSVIAQHYHTSTRQIKRLNHLRSNRIRMGKTLLIPVPRAYATQLAKQTKHPYKGHYHIHKVKQNESLWTIAHYYNTTPRKLCEWNKISIRTPIYKGQRLKIHSNQYGRHITYHLKAGESLWTLSQRYNISTQQIARWNALKSSSILHPGQPIKLWIKS